MGDTLRGNGLFTASARLAALADDSARLARARNRFSESPPSGTTTRSESSDSPSEEQYRYDQRVVQLTLEHGASWPRNQWEDEAKEEGHRILRAKIEEEDYVHVPDATGLPPPELLSSAREVVTKRWIEQGIWNDKWQPGLPDGRWKHQEPLDMESESDSEDDEEIQTRPPFSVPAKPKAPKKEEEKLQRLAERQMRREGEREASRPFNRFVQQVSEERGRIRSNTRSAAPDVLDPANINTTAYDNVRERWVKRGIWNQKWGTIPGMNWKHEQDLHRWLLEELGPRPEAPPERTENETREAARQLFGPFPPVQPPVLGLLEESPTASAIIDQTGSQNGDEEQFPLEPNHADHSAESGQGELPAATSKQTEKPKPARKERAGRGAGAARGPADSAAKVSKATPKKTKSTASRGKKASSEAQPSQAKLKLEVDEPAAPYSPETPRRSTRLRSKKV
ncbi:major royal jelly protein [Apiospora arundinis]|uniref:Major royal jelly protein n=1 Tax=Apiospora arundinis TaxID=335852 RepID=A0ABR2HT15_9PEZI